MDKVLLIMQRELLTRLRKRSFILLTLFTPFIMVAVVAVPLWLASLSDEAERIAVIDHTGLYMPHLQSNDRFHFVPHPTEANRDSLLHDKATLATLEITADLSLHPHASTLKATEQVPLPLTEHIDRTLSERIREQRIAAYHIPELDRIMAEADVRYQVRTLRVDADGGQSEASAGAAMAIGGVFTFFIYMFILSYGSMMMQSVLEEKTGRIVEVIVSSVKPWQLLWGKLLGIASVGLVQMSLWGIMLGGMALASGTILALAFPEASANPDVAGFMAGLGSIDVAPIMLCFVLYFIGGYFLYASIFAAVGASVNEQEDTQQFMTPIMLLLVFASYAGMYSIGNPTGPLAVWCSYIPFTSPIVMMVRLPFGVSFWEVALSLTLLYTTTALVAWAGGQIYRVGILLYGKKPTLLQMLRWITWK